MEPDSETIIAELGSFCAAQDVAAWLVGGAARDLARGRTPGDIDLAVDGDGLAVARALADARGGAFVALDDARATGRAVIPNAGGGPALVVDIARLRSATIDGDLRLRDFSINAMAIALGPEPLRAGFSQKPGSWIDPCGGLGDLRAGRLRPCGPTSLRDDPLRILRAARLCAELRLRPVNELADQIHAASAGLDQVASERVRDELLRLLDTPAATPWLRYLDDCGALTRVIPELEPARTCTQPNVHFLPVLAHILETVTALEWIIGGLPFAAEANIAEEPVAVQLLPELPRELPYAERFAALLEERRGGGRRRVALLKLAALLHDNAKPQTKQVYPDGKVSFYGHQELGAVVAAQIGRRLRLSRPDTTYITTVVREHMRPGQLRTSEVVTARAVARFFRELGDTGPDVLLHELADHIATRGPQLQFVQWQTHLAWVAAMLDTYWGQPEAQRVPLVRGGDLIAELGVKPGPGLGALLRELNEAQTVGEIATREEAIALARQLLAISSS